MSYQSKFVDANGLQLHYLDWGNHHLPHLVLVHGIHGHAHVWNTFVESVRDDYHVMALDMRGHGDSEWSSTGAYGAEDHLVDFSTFVNSLGLAPFTLVGQSLGGIVAFAFASLNPGAVKQLVIVDIGPEFGGEGIEQIQQVAQARPSSFDDVEDAIRWAAEDESQIEDSDFRRDVERNLRRTGEGRLEWKYDPLVDKVLDSGGSNSAPILWDLWANIQSQTLVVRGQHSSVLTPEIARQMVAKGEHFELAEIPDAHHSVIDQNPGAFRDTVKGFLGVR